MTSGRYTERCRSPQAKKILGVSRMVNQIIGVSRMARRRRRKILVLGNVCRNGGMACGPSAAVCRRLPPGRMLLPERIREAGRGGCPQDDTTGRTRCIGAPGLQPGPGERRASTSEAAASKPRLNHIQPHPM